MPKAVSKSLGDECDPLKKLNAEFDQMVVKMNTPAARAACVAFFAASSVEMGRTTMNALLPQKRQPSRGRSSIT